MECMLGDVLEMMYGLRVCRSEDAEAKGRVEKEPALVGESSALPSETKTASHRIAGRVPVLYCNYCNYCTWSLLTLYTML